MEGRSSPKTREAVPRLELEQLKGLDASELVTRSELLKLTDLTEGQLHSLIRQGIVPKAQYQSPVGALYPRSIVSDILSDPNVFHARQVWTRSKQLNERRGAAKRSKNNRDLTQSRIGRPPGAKNKSSVRREKEEKQADREHARRGQLDSVAQRKPPPLKSLELPPEAYLPAGYFPTPAAKTTLTIHERFNKRDAARVFATLSHGEPLEHLVSQYGMHPYAVKVLLGEYEKLRGVMFIMGDERERISRLLRIPRVTVATLIDAIEKLVTKPAPPPTSCSNCCERPAGLCTRCARRIFYGDPIVAAPDNGTGNDNGAAGSEPEVASSTDDITSSQHPHP